MTNFTTASLTNCENPNITELVANSTLYKSYDIRFSINANYTSVVADNKQGFICSLLEEIRTQVDNLTVVGSLDVRPGKFVRRNLGLTQWLTGPMF